MKKGEKVICIECNKPSTHKGDVFKVHQVVDFLGKKLLDLGIKTVDGHVDWQMADRFRLLDYENILIGLAFEADRRSIEKLDMSERIFSTTAKF